MKLSRCIIIPLLLFCLVSMVAGEKNPSFRKQDRIPVVDIVKAIQLTVDHHQKEHPDMGDIFVDEAMYMQTEDESFWKIGVRLKARETGHHYYKVTSEGKVESLSAVKDG